MDKKIFIERISTVTVILAIIVMLLNARNLHFALTFLGLIESDVVSYSLQYNRAVDLEAKGSLFEAKSAYQDLINRYPFSKDTKDWRSQVGRINIKLLFSPIMVSKSKLYEIQEDDTLAGIAKRFNTTPELIIKSNDLENTAVEPGKKIKICTATFNVFVDKSRNKLTLKSDGEVVKAYIVSTGANGSSPAGNFKITDRIANFTLSDAEQVSSVDSPMNIEGSHWLGLDIRGYGIYGIDDIQNLGKQVTQGCIIMSNHDIEELYTIVPVGTEVTIVN